MEAMMRGKTSHHRAAMLWSILHGNVKRLATDFRPHQWAVETKSHYLNHRVSNRGSSVFTFHRTDFLSLIAGSTWTRNNFHTVTLNSLWFGFPTDGPWRDDCTWQQKGTTLRFPSWLQLWSNDFHDMFSPFPKSSNESAEVFQHIQIKLIHLDELL